MIVSERGGMPASLSPKRRSEPRIISVCALPASARSISGISIAARPSSRRMSRMSSTCSSTAAETAPAVIRQISTPASRPRQSSPRPTRGGASSSDSREPALHGAQPVGTARAPAAARRRSRTASGGSGRARRSRPTPRARGDRRRRARTRPPGCPPAGTTTASEAPSRPTLIDSPSVSRPTASTSATTYGFERETSAGTRVNVRTTSMSGIERIWARMSPGSWLGR